MKKLVFLLLVLFSCEKPTGLEEKICWDCRRDVVTQSSLTSVVIRICDMTEDEIRKLEIENSFTNEKRTVTMTCWASDSTHVK